jgi:hypothetical protein
MIKSKAEASFLAIHKPAVLHELSGGSIPNFKSLPKHAGRSADIAKRARKRYLGNGG